MDKIVAPVTQESSSAVVGNLQTGLQICLDRKAILEEAGEIVASIRSQPDTPRHCTTEQKTLREIRGDVEKHIKNSYLKRIDAPVGVKPTLKCWMELNEG